MGQSVPNIVYLAHQEATQNVKAENAGDEFSFYNYEEGYEQSLQRLKLRSFAQDIGARRSYAQKIFILIVSWLWGILILLILQGFGSEHHIFKLSDSVMLAIVGGTTINILGLFVIVVNYLFEKRNGKMKQEAVATKE